VGVAKRGKAASNQRGAEYSPPSVKRLRRTGLTDRTGSAPRRFFQTLDLDSFARSRSFDFASLADYTAPRQLAGQGTRGKAVKIGHGPATVNGSHLP
jgi:hypothetical protein